MAKQYTYQEADEPMMVSEDVQTYPQGITIPITLPTTGCYSVEHLKKEMTDFAMKLLSRTSTKSTATHTTWRNMVVSESVKAMTLGPSELSKDIRSDKEMLAEALEEKYR